MTGCKDNETHSLTRGTRQSASLEWSFHSIPGRHSAGTSSVWPRTQQQPQPVPGNSISFLQPQFVQEAAFHPAVSSTGPNTLFYRLQYSCHPVTALFFCLYNSWPTRTTCFPPVCCPLPTPPSDSRYESFLGFPICAQYCWLLAVKGQCGSSQRSASGYIFQL